MKSPHIPPPAQIHHHRAQGSSHPRMGRDAHEKLSSQIIVLLQEVIEYR